VARSYATADTGLANKLFDDSLFVTSGNGRIKDKKGEMADVGPLQPGFEIHYFRTSRVQPQAGVVTGLAEWSWTWNGRTTVTRRRYTAVYVRGGPLGWRMVATAHWAGAGGLGESWRRGYERCRKTTPTCRKNALFSRPIDRIFAPHADGCLTCKVLVPL
jgi:hypothetical protein